MRFSVCQQSHIGARRLNQDRVGYSYTGQALLLVLADGMGGHPGGEIAAALALQAVMAQFAAQATPRVAQPGRFLDDAFQQAHLAILRHHAAGGGDSPRTTLLACLVQDGVAQWAHCGDSRLYWLRGGALLAHTRDHSHIEYLIATGRVSETERASHPGRHRLYNCVGANLAPQVALSAPVALAAGDVLMLCSDGVWSVLPEAQLCGALRSAPALAVPALIDAALAAADARADNATALALRWADAAADAIDTASLAPGVCCRVDDAACAPAAAPLP